MREIASPTTVILRSGATKNLLARINVVVTERFFTAFRMTNTKGRRQYAPYNCHSEERGDEESLGKDKCGGSREILHCVQNDIMFILCKTHRKVFNIIYTTKKASGKSDAFKFAFKP